MDMIEGPEDGFMNDDGSYGPRPIPPAPAQIAAFTGPNYARNAARVTGENYPCVICGREVKGSYRWLVRLSTSNTIHSPDDDLGVESMGLFPIGSDCLRQHPEIKPLARRYPFLFARSKGP